MLPRLRGKILQTNRGDSTFDVYDRMVAHLSLELNRLNSELEVRDCGLRRRE
jgi:hypothetical protein